MLDLNMIKEQLSSVAKRNQNSFDDEREFKLAKDDKGNGAAIIRFLPNKNLNSSPVVKVVEYNIWTKNTATGKWNPGYREKSLTTIGKADPVAQAYYELVATGLDKYKEIAKKLTRKNVFISNVYVIKDANNPDVNGKVFYYKYGTKIMEKIMAMISPDETMVAAGVKPINVFDPFEGANFSLIFTKNQYGGTYDNSRFDNPSALFPDKTQEEVQQWIQKKCLDLEKEFTDPETFKSFDELKALFARSIAGSDIEKALLEIGSSVITEPYDRPDNPNKNLKAQVTKTQEIKQESVQQTQLIQNTQPVQTETETQTSQLSQSTEDIDALLDDILGD